MRIRCFLCQVRGVADIQQAAIRACDLQNAIPCPACIVPSLRLAEPMPCPGNRGLGKGDTRKKLGHMRIPHAVGTPRPAA